MRVVIKKFISDKNYRHKHKQYQSQIGSCNFLIAFFSVFQLIDMQYHSFIKFNFKLKLKTENNKTTKQQNHHLSYVCLVQLVHSFCFVICIWVSSLWKKLSQGYFCFCFCLFDRNNRHNHQNQLLHVFLWCKDCFILFLFHVWDALSCILNVWELLNM